MFCIFILFQTTLGIRSRFNQVKCFVFSFYFKPRWVFVVDFGSAREEDRRLIVDMICRRCKGQSCPYPEFSTLPKFRLNDSRLFAIVGVDLCGPIFVKKKFTLMVKIGCLRRGWSCILFIESWDCVTSFKMH